MIENEIKEPLLKEPLLNQADQTLAKIIVLNGTTKNGLAKSVAEKLEKLNFEVVLIDNAWPQNYQQTNFYATNQGKKQTNEILEEQLKVNLNKELLSITNLPTQIKQYQMMADYVIILGSEYVE